jgi:predicted Ser/Thr protein kinase
MSIQSIAHYRIGAKLGEGGMGAVYRATDTKLDREVAVKVLPAEVANDPDRLARFTREAKVLASLNHPNIAAIYGVEEHALIMELVEGQILTGPLPVETALTFARQITEALDYAHEKGIIHRDLKPANILITPDGQVKILDFGLAKIADPSASSGDPALSPTVVNVSATGIIMGTAAYMAPEQARGHRLDKRADIWAFGVVLYEMLTGKRLFEGESIGDTLAEVLKKEIDLSVLPPETPDSLRTLMQRCLERDRKQRLRDFGDAWVQTTQTKAVQQTKRDWRPWLVAAALAIVAAVALWKSPRGVISNNPLLALDLDAGRGPVYYPAVSADGSRVAFVAGNQLMTRRLNERQATILKGTEGATYPFFSPDAQWIGYFAGDKLYKIAVEGGAPVALADAPLARAGSWGEDNQLVIMLRRQGIVRTSASGGPTEKITGPLSGLGMVGIQILPRGRGVLYGIEGRIEVHSNGKTKGLVENAELARYLDSGHLVYCQRPIIYAAPFDVDRLEITGPPVVLAGPVGDDPIDRPSFDISPTGTLIYTPGLSEETVLAWIDGTGNVTPEVKDKVSHWGPRLSPDGTLLAHTSGQKIWIRDLNRQTAFAPSLSVRGELIWSPDSKFLVSSTMWVSRDGSQSGGWSGRAPGLGLGFPFTFTPDGRSLLFRSRPTVDFDISFAPVKQTAEGLDIGEPAPLVTHPGDQVEPEFSPDGRWLAYSTNESGKPEIVVVPFSGDRIGRGKWQVSTTGGRRPKWSRAGNQIIFIGADNRLYTVPYTAGPERFDAGSPRLFSTRKLASSLYRGNYDLDRDGKRVIAVLPPEGEEEAPNSILRVLLNASAELRRKTQTAIDPR